MGFLDRLRNLSTQATGPQHPDGEAELVVGDASYDGWDIVQDFGELETARAFRQSLTDRGQRAILTSDWPLDEFGRGDISLRVPPGQGTDAEEMLEDPE
ncbi:hypothetical protein HJD18_13850 [Thermoleophilia bacterium SCSIO 60948]|nr:hypothetical protein HJD18_13850 [Thermoleophilia bacterium SCSIO 60948]